MINNWNRPYRLYKFPIAAFICFVIMWVVWVAAVLCCIGGVVWMAWHFISKYW